MDENATYHCFEINSKKQQENNKKRGAIYRPVSQSKSVIQTHRQCVAPAITIKQRSSRSDDGKRERERESKIVRGLKALYLVHLAAAAEWHSDGAPDEKLCCGGWELCTGRLLARLYCIPYSINCNTYEREKTFRELQIRTNTTCFQARVNGVSPKFRKR